MAAGALLHPVALEDSSLLSLHAAFPERYPALFESAAAGGALGRYDILFAHPGARLTLLGDGTLSGPERSSRRAASCRTGSVVAVGSAPVQERPRCPSRAGGCCTWAMSSRRRSEPRLRLPMPAIVRSPGSAGSNGDRAGAWRRRLDRRRARHGVASSPPSGAIWKQCRPSRPMDRAAARRAHPRRAGLSGFSQAVRRAPRVHRRRRHLSGESVARLARDAACRGCSRTHVYHRLRETNPGPFSGCRAAGRYRRHQFVARAPGARCATAAFDASDRRHAAARRRSSRRISRSPASCMRIRRSGRSTSC